MRSNRWFSSILTTVSFTGVCALSACSGGDENAVGTNGALSGDPLLHDKVQKGSGSTTALPPEDPPPCDQDGPVTVVGNDSTKLWPPNHKFWEIAAPDCVGATDACGQALLGDFVWASSDEPVDDLGDGHFGPDVGLGVDVHHACVRSERQGPKDGRVYKLGVTFTDANGNTADGSCTIIVDHDQRGVTGVDSNDAYKLTFDASQAGLNCDGTPPGEGSGGTTGGGGNGGTGGTEGGGGNGGDGSGGTFCAPDDCLTGNGGNGGDGSGGGSAGTEGGGGNGGDGSGGGSAGTEGGGGNGGDGSGGGSAGESGGGGSGGDGSNGNGGAGGSGGNGGTPLPGNGGPD
jgi:hypothetical protein